MPTPVLIDCDPGHDDAIALLLALASPELEVLAVTTVAGNAPLERTTLNALRVLEVAGRRDVAVAAGAERPLLRPPAAAPAIHGESGLQGPQWVQPGARPRPGHAVDLLAATVAAARQPPTLIALGPLTNLALALAVHPQLPEQLDRVVFMGGAVGLGNRTPAAEFNIWADPEAAQRVLSSGLQPTMVGLDVTLRATLDDHRRERLRAAGEAGRFVAELLDHYGSRYRERMGLPQPPVHDALAVAAVIDPTLVTTRPLAVGVETSSELCRAARWSTSTG